MTREEAIQWLTDIKENITENWSHDVAIDMAIESLSADEVLKVAEWQGEIVRCKDCKWQKINRKSGTLNCGHKYGMINAEDDNFCSYGERKEE